MKQGIQAMISHGVIQKTLILFVKKIIVTKSFCFLGAPILFLPALENKVCKLWKEKALGELLSQLIAR